MRWRPSPVLGEAPNYTPFEVAAHAATTGAARPAHDFWRRLAESKKVSAEMVKLAGEMARRVAEAGASDIAGRSICDAQQEPKRTAPELPFWFVFHASTPIPAFPQSREMAPSDARGREWKTSRQRIALHHHVAPLVHGYQAARCISFVLVALGQHALNRVDALPARDRLRASLHVRHIA
jgi:hypothetical protein